MEEKRFLDKNEEEIATEAYDLLEHALSLMDSNFYGDALKMLKQAAKLFEKISRKEELEAIHNKIAQIKSMGNVYQKELEQRRKTDLELEEQIRKIVEEAGKIARQHENEMQEALKEGRIVSESKYPLVVKKYEEIIELLKERGWTSQIEVYEETINAYQQKLDNELKVRKLEKQKLEERQKQMGFRRLTLKEVLKIVDGEAKEKILEEMRKKGEESELDVLIESIDRELKYREKEYQKTIKQGNFEENRPYEKIIIVYEVIKDYLNEKNKFDEVSIYDTLIQKLEREIIKDDKLREIEAQKLKKQKEFEELKKTKISSIVDVEDQEAISKKKTIPSESEEKIDIKIDSIIDTSNILEREYQKYIKQGNFGVECPYGDIVKNYEKIQQLLKDNNRHREAKLYENTIQLYKQKIEQDKKLREKEIEKIKKQEELVALQKIGVESDETEKKKKQVTIPTEKGKHPQFQEIIHGIEKAEKEIKYYETILKKDFLKHKSPYDKIINTYKTAQNDLKNIGWDEEANRLNESINFYIEKKEKDDQLRASERVKIKKRQEEFKREKELEISSRIETEKELKKKEMLIEEKERKKAEKLAQAEKIFNDIKLANQLAEEYEIKIKKGIFSEPSKYINVIKVYEEAKKSFETMEWVEEADKLTDSIKFYKSKLEEEDDLKQQLKLQKRKGEQLENGYKLMDEASRLLIDNKFNEALNLYKKARNIFQILEHPLELDKIRIAINELNRKSEVYEENIIEAKKREENLRKEQELLEQKATLEREKVQRKLAEKQQKLIQLKQKEEINKEISAEALSIINRAEELVTYYEKQIKEGKRPNCVYDNVIDLYKTARKKLTDVGWEEEASKLEDSIKYYEEKSEIDKKLRDLESLRQEEARIEKQAYEYMDKAAAFVSTKNFTESLNFYEKARSLFEKINRDLEIEKIQQSILEVKDKRDRFHQRLEEIKKKREKMIREQQDLEMKTVIERKKMQEELLEKQKQFNLLKEKEQKDKEISKEALLLINRAEEMAKSYEEGIKKGRRAKICPYQEIIEFYNNAFKKFKSIGWEDEIGKLEESIKYYEEKLKNDLKIRELEKLKLKEVEIQREAYKLMDEAVKKINKKEFENALILYEKAKILFEQIESSFEIEKINQSIAELKEIKENYEKDVLEEKLKIQEQQEELKRLEAEAHFQKLQKQRELEKQRQNFLKSQEEDSKKQELYNKAINLINKAENLAKNYEEKIKEGQVMDSVYVQVIGFYKEAINIFENIDRQEEIERLQEAIEFYQDKLDHEQRLRTLISSMQKDKELNTKAYQLMDEAVSLLKLKQFDKSIELFIKARELFEQTNSELEIEKINISIEGVERAKEQYHEKLEEIRQLKKQEEEALQRLEKQAKESMDSFQEELKIKNEQLLEAKKQEKEKKEISNKALKLISKAEEMALIYDESIKKGKRPKCIYSEVIKKYQKALELFQSIGWEEEAKKMEKPIIFYQNKLEQDILLRKREIAIKEEEDIASRAFQLMDEAINSVNMKDFDEAINYYREAKELFTNINRPLEVEKIEISIQEVEKEKGLYYQKLENLRIKRTKEQENLLKMEIEAKNARIILQKEMERKNQELLEISKKEKENKRISERALLLISEAENMGEEYNNAIKQGKRLECIYPTVIKMHQEAMELLQSIGWGEEASKVKETIEFYEDKLKEDQNLREREAASLREEEVSVEGYALLEEAISLANINNYDEAINKYKEALSLFESINRNIETEKITISIMELSQEKQDQQRKIEAEKKRKELQKIEQEKIEEQAKAARLKLQEDLENKKTEYLSIKERKKEEKEKSENALSIINQAEEMVESYEESLNQGIFPPCVYPEVIKMYEEAAQLLQNIEWTEEVSKIKESIKTYKNKNEQDNLLRETQLVKEKEKEIATKGYDLMEQAISLVNVQEYNEALKIYEQAKELFQNLDRSIEIDKIEASIEELQRIQEEKLYKLKKKRMEDIKRKREKEAFEEELKAQRLMLKEVMEEKKQKVLEIKRKVEKENKISSEAFSLINRAENLVETYKMSLTKGENPEINYDKVIELYQEAAEKFKSIQWEEEVNKLQDAIALYIQRKEDEEILRKLEKERKTEEEEVEKANELMKKATDLFNLSNYASAIETYEKVSEIFRKLEREQELNTIENLIQGIEEKKNAEERALEEEEKYRKEIEAELIKRQLEIAKEYSEEQKRKQQERELERKEKLIEQKQKAKAKKAYKYIDEAERMAEYYELDVNIPRENVEKLFNSINELYEKARTIFREINWIDDANTLEETIEYYEEKRKADREFRAIQKEKNRQELEELQRMEELARVAREEEEYLKKQEERLLLQAQKIAKEHNEKKSDAFNFLDEAKEVLAQKDFDTARDLYKKAGNLFNEIKWEEGILMINESLESIEKREKEWERQIQEEKEKKADREKNQKELDQKIAEFEKIREEQLEQTNKELLEKRAQQKEEREIANRAYNLLEEGTRYLEFNKFKQAEDKYIQARELFNEIGWSREVSKINNESLLNLRNKKVRLERSREEHRKAIELKEKRKKELERHKQQREEALKKLRKIQIMDKIDETIQKDYDNAQNYFNSQEYNKGVLILKDVMERLENAGKSDDVKSINSQIEKIKEQSRIPIITLEVVEQSDEESFEAAWKALDRAQNSLSNHILVKAISELNEALFNIKKTKLKHQFLKQIIHLINEINSEMGIKRFIPLEEEAEEGEAELNDENLKHKMEERRKIREKRILDLLKKKNVE